MNWYKSSNVNPHLLTLYKEAGLLSDISKKLIPLQMAVLFSLGAPVADAFASRVKSNDNPRTITNKAIESVNQNKSISPQTSQKIKNQLTENLSKIEDVSTPPPAMAPKEVKVPEKPKYDFNFVARVIFAETANASPKERELVAGVIKNRMNNPQAFGKLKNLEKVVKQRHAFEAIGDKHNKNWAKSKNPQRLQGSDAQAWEQSVQLAKGNIAAALGPSGRPLVYYHDKSIGKPRGWDNNVWRAIKEVETEKLIFYSIIPAK